MTMAVTIGSHYPCHHRRHHHRDQTRHMRNRHHQHRHRVPRMTVSRIAQLKLRANHVRVRQQTKLQDSIAAKTSVEPTVYEAPLSCEESLVETMR